MSQFIKYFAIILRLHNMRILGYDIKKCIFELLITIINITIMKFKYSICDPLEKEIKYIPESFYGDEILKIAKEYPWVEKLRITEKFKPEEIHFNPSLDFTNIDTITCICQNFSNFDIVALQIINRLIHDFRKNGTIL